jgi:hypothetical protein
LLAATPPDEDTGHITYGTVASVADDRITLKTRAGWRVTIETSQRTRSYAQATPGAALQVRWRERAAGVHIATDILPAAADSGMWGADR